MNKLSTLLTLLLLVSGLAACGGDTAPEAASEEPGHQHVHEEDLAGRPAASEAEMQDGVQVIQIAVGEMGYEPRSIHLKADIPARLVFTRTLDSSCAEQVQIPDFGIEKTDLPMNEAVAITFTPDEGGEFAFVCGMGMMKGTIVVKM